MSATKPKMPAIRQLQPSPVANIATPAHAAMPKTKEPIWRLVNPFRLTSKL